MTSINFKCAGAIRIAMEGTVWRELRDGRLESVIPDWAPPILGLHLVMPPGTLRPLRVQKLVDHLTRSLASPPWLTQAKRSE